MTIRTETGYPWNGNVSYAVAPDSSSAEFTLAVRIPGWCRDFLVSLNGELLRRIPGSARRLSVPEPHWKTGDTLKLSFDMPVHRVYANPLVREDAGCVALMRGPLVYCFEQEDNGPNLQTLRIPTDAVLTVENASDPALGAYTAVKATGLRLAPGSDLYSSKPPKRGRNRPSRNSLLSLGKSFGGRNESLDARNRPEHV